MVDQLCLIFELSQTTCCTLVENEFAFDFDVLGPTLVNLQVSSRELLPDHSVTVSVNLNAILPSLNHSTS